MLKVGLTGNIGSGKTTVSKIFEIIGIPVFHADVVAKQLYTLPDVINEVKNKLGAEVFTDNIVDFKKLASAIFSDHTKLKILNQIIHPKVYEAAERWFKQQSGVPYIVHESAILFENNLQGRYDKIINVSADMEVRLRRVIERDGTNRKEVERRISNQMSDIEKTKLADFIIYNNEDDLLIPQVLKIHKDLSK